ERAAPRQSDIGLAVGKGAAAEVDIDIVEPQALGLVNGERPGEPDRELAKRAGYGADNFFLLVVVRVTPLLPAYGFELMLTALHFDENALVFETRDAGDRAVDPAALRIIAQENDLGAFLER